MLLEGGKGSDVMRGGRDGDIYIINEGDGDDRPTDDLVTDNFDMVQFTGTISAETIAFVRDGESDDLQLVMLDADGNASGDRVTLEGQFNWVSMPWFGILWADRIEYLGFADGSFMTDSDIMARVLEDARTDGEDVIYGFNNADTLDGGAGDDLLVGRAQDDVYVYGREYGRDVIAASITDILEVRAGFTRRRLGMRQRARTRRSTSAAGPCDSGKVERSQPHHGQWADAAF